MKSISTLLFQIGLKAVSLNLSILTAAVLQGCGDQGVVDALTVPLKNSDLYEYATAVGDEDGVRISKQASHYEVSEIRRDETTNFIPVYTYRSTVGYAGTDYVELEIRSGSDGASPPTSIRTVRITFVVSN